jgi:hypothetical protein
MSCARSAYSASCASDTLARLQPTSLAAGGVVERIGAVEKCDEREREKEKGQANEHYNQ